MSCVEAFATGIKMNQAIKSFLRADQRIKVASELQKSKDQERTVPIRPLTRKKMKRSRAFEEMIKRSSTLFADQKS